MAETTLPPERRAPPLTGGRAPLTSSSWSRRLHDLCRRIPTLVEIENEKSFAGWHRRDGDLWRTCIAADMPTRAPVHKSIAHFYDWSGWYAGYNAGVSASQINASTPGDTSGSTDVAGRGFVGGVQGGYNWHITPSAVAGVEGDLGFLRLKRSVIDYNDGETFSAKTQGYATFRARLGYSTGPSLFYLTGGIGLVRLTNTISEEGQGSNSTSRTKSGLVVGAGMETMLGGNWSARIEYLDLRAGDVSADGDPAEASTVLFENRFHVFRYGLNYRFGGAAPALPAYNWSGFYAGVNAGVTFSQVGVTAPTADDAVTLQP